MTRADAPCSISARRKRLTLATAESCTGGLVAGALTDIAGSSAVVDRGFVTYTNEAKQQMLGVPADDAATSYGAVSRETAEAMAQGALAHSPADLAVSITGIAGPGGGIAGQAGRARAFRRRPRAAAALIHRERRFGDIGRAEVRRLFGAGGAGDAVRTGRQRASKLRRFCAHRPRRRALEGRGEAAERHVEHRAHQQPQRAAAELVVDEELDLAGRVAGRAGRSSGSACG